MCKTIVSNLDGGIFVLTSRWVRIPVKILLIWLVITLYFYFQHPVIYRFKDLNAVIPVGEMTLVIEEINLHNLDEQERNKWIWSRENVPWQYQILFRIDPKWQIPASKILSFYSRPPLTADYGTLQVSGTVIFPEEMRNGTDEHISIHDVFSLNVYPGYTSGQSSTFRDGDNYCTICAHGKLDFDDMNRELILSIEDKQRDVTTRLLFTPSWTKERRLTLASHNQSPLTPVERFITKISIDQPQEALQYVVPVRREKFVIPDDLGKAYAANKTPIRYTLNWLNLVEGYQGVYQVKAEVGSQVGNLNEDNIHNFTAQAVYTFFVTKEESGDYKIIYAR